jgi:hypothetical protein
MKSEHGEQSILLEPGLTIAFWYIFVLNNGSSKIIIHQIFDTFKCNRSLGFNTHAFIFGTFLIIFVYKTIKVHIVLDTFIPCSITFVHKV